MHWPVLVWTVRIHVFQALCQDLMKLNMLFNFLSFLISRNHCGIWLSYSKNYEVFIKNRVQSFSWHNNDTNESTIKLLIGHITMMSITNWSILYDCERMEDISHHNWNWFCVWYNFKVVLFPYDVSSTPNKQWDFGASDTWEDYTLTLPI